MTNPQHEALVEAKAAALVALTYHGISPDVQELLVNGDGRGTVAPGALDKAVQAVAAALSATAATPSDEVVRLRAALKRCAEIVDRNLYRQHEKIEDVPKIARAALEPQAKD